MNLKIVLCFIGGIFGILFCILVINHYIKRYYNLKKLKNFIYSHYQQCIVGEEGSGKSALCSLLCYGVSHNCNIPMQEDTNIISIDSLKLPNINFDSLISNSFKSLDFNKYKHFESLTIIDDANVFLNNIHDKELKSMLNGFDVVYPLWRQLFNNTLLFNVQNIERLWKPLRELFLSCCCCNSVRFGKYYCYFDITLYERLSDYLNGLNPLKKKFFGKNSSSEIVELSKRGLINRFVVKVPIYMINHDSHFYRNLIFKEVD